MSSATAAWGEAPGLGDGTFEKLPRNGVVANPFIILFHYNGLQILLCKLGVKKDFRYLGLILFKP